MNGWTIYSGFVAWALAIGWIAGPSAAQSSYPPPIDRTASKNAQAKVTEINKEMSAKNAAANTIVVQMQRDFEASPDWQSTEEALKSARTDYDALTRPILEAVQAKPEYKLALSEITRLEQELKNYQSMPGAKGDKVHELANEVLAARTKTTRLETEALSAEPRVEELRKMMAEATARQAELKQQLDEQVRNSETWQAARKEVDAVKEKLEVARKELEDARKREGELERQRQKQISDIKRQEAERRRQEREAERNRDRNR